MIEHLTQIMGKPDLVINNPTLVTLQVKGIIVVKGHGWSNARGHVTLWNGSVCSDQCHLLNDPDNGTFVPEVGILWVLP